LGTILCATRGGEGSQHTQDAAIALAKEQDALLVFVFVADVSFLSGMAAPIVVDVEQQLEQMGRFELARAQVRARKQGVEAEDMIRSGRFRTELIDAAAELCATMIVLGRPRGPGAVFEEATLEAFAADCEEHSGVEVRVL
jgi:nucleotide-binding universal stress UspA family protein